MEKEITHNFFSKRKELEKQIETQEKELQQDLRALQIALAVTGASILVYNLFKKKSLKKKYKKAEAKAEIIYEKPKKTFLSDIKREISIWLQQFAIEELQRQMISLTSQVLKKYGNLKETSTKEEEREQDTLHSDRS